MTTNISGISFHGSSESTGSASRKVRYANQCPPTEQGCDTVSFRGNAYPYYAEPEKKKSPLLKGIIVVGLLAAKIGLCGWLHKSGKVAKLKDGWFKNKLAEPVTNKCHEWCSWTKGKGTKAWDKIKGVFHKDK